MAFGDFPQQFSEKFQEKLKKYEEEERKAMTGCEEDSYQVELYIYDISRGFAKSTSSALLGKQIEGIWHTGIVAYGREYYFGSGGIDSCRPGGTILGEPERTEDLGLSQVPYHLFLEYIFGLGESTYKPGAYDLLKHNCNHFSEEVSEFLCGRGIPKSILELPDEVLNTPLGETLAPIAKSLQLKNNDVPTVNLCSLNNAIRNYVPRDFSRFREDPELEELNNAIEEVRLSTKALECRRNSLNEKLLKKERKARKKEKRERKKKHRSSSVVGEEAKDVRRRRRQEGGVRFALDVKDSPSPPEVERRRYSDPGSPEPLLLPPSYPRRVPLPILTPLSLPIPPVTERANLSPCRSRVSSTMDADGIEDVPLSDAPSVSEQDTAEEPPPEVEREPPILYKEAVDVSNTTTNNNVLGLPPMNHSSSSLGLPPQNHSSSSLTSHSSSPSSDDDDDSSSSSLTTSSSCSSSSSGSSSSNSYSSSSSSSGHAIPTAQSNLCIDFLRIQNSGIISRKSAENSYQILPSEFCINRPRNSFMKHTRPTNLNLFTEIICKPQLKNMENVAMGKSKPYVSSIDQGNATKTGFNPEVKISKECFDVLPDTFNIFENKDKQCEDLRPKLLDPHPRYESLSGVRDGPTFPLSVEGCTDSPSAVEGKPPISRLKIFATDVKSNIPVENAVTDSSPYSEQEYIIVKVTKFLDRMKSKNVNQDSNSSTPDSGIGLTPMSSPVRTKCDDRRILGLQESCTLTEDDPLCLSDGGQDGINKANYSELREPCILEERIIEDACEGNEDSFEGILPRKANEIIDTNPSPLQPESDSTPSSSGGDDEMADPSIVEGSLSPLENTSNLSKDLQVHIDDKLSRSSTQSSVDSSLSFGSSYYTLYIVDPNYHSKSPQEELSSHSSSSLPEEGISRSSSQSSICSFKTITPEPKYFEENDRTFRAMRGLASRDQLKCEDSKTDVGTNFVSSPSSRICTNGLKAVNSNRTQLKRSNVHNLRTRSHFSVPNLLTRPHSSVSNMLIRSHSGIFNFLSCSNASERNLLTQSHDSPSHPGVSKSLTRSHSNVCNMLTQSYQVLSCSHSLDSVFGRSSFPLLSSCVPTSHFSDPTAITRVSDPSAITRVSDPSAIARVSEYFSPENKRALSPPDVGEPWHLLTHNQPELGRSLVFENVSAETVSDFDGFVNIVADMLTPDEQRHMEEFRAYVVEDEGSWALGEDFNILFARVFHDPAIPDEARRHLLRIMAAAALKDDVILMLHQDRKEHTIMNFANKVESLNPDIQEALALFFCNMFEHPSPSEWLLYISEWNEPNQPISNIRVTTKVAVNALLHSNPQVQEYGTALMYNLGTKEVKTVVFDDVAPELAMAILQFFDGNSNEEYVWRVMTALCKFCYASSEVPMLIKMIGPDPNTFKGMSERIDIVLDELNIKLNRVRDF